MIQRKKRWTNNWSACWLVSLSKPQPVLKTIASCWFILCPLCWQHNPFRFLFIPSSSSKLPSSVRRLGPFWPRPLSRLATISPRSGPANVVVTLGFQRSPIRAAVQRLSEEEEITAAPCAPFLSSHKLLDGWNNRAIQRTSDRLIHSVGREMEC